RRARKQLWYDCATPSWPPAAAACSSCMACGRRAQPSRCMPAAIAPLETSTQRRPSECSAAICCARRAIASRSRPLPSRVTSEEPTLTTIISAEARGLGCTARPGFGFFIEKFKHGSAKLAAPGAAERRHHEPGALPAQRLDDFSRARARVRHGVRLVEDEPARFPVQGGVVFLQFA